MDKLKNWISENPLMAAGVFLGAGAVVTYLVLHFMGKKK